MSSTGAPGGSASSLEAPDRERLVDEREFLRRSLADLEAERAAGELAAADYEQLRARYEARVAEVEEALGGTSARGAAMPAGSAAAPVSTSALEAEADGPGRARPGRLAAGLRRHRSAVGWTAVGCFVAAAALLGLALGGVAPFASSGGLPLQVRIRTELAEAAALAENHNVLEAVAVYDKVLALDPRQPEALAEGGWLVRLAGLSSHRASLVRGGDNEIAEAVVVAPSLAVPRAYEATALLEDDHQPAAAAAELVAMLGDHPSHQLVSSVRGVAVRAFAAAHRSLPAAFRFGTSAG